MISDRSGAQPIILRTLVYYVSSDYKNSYTTAAIRNY
jgi:hypothetical protein